MRDLILADFITAEIRFAGENGLSVHFTKDQVAQTSTYFFEHWV